ncbi:hypothetical protein JQ604_05220 [Bradyrhizobium jicamae]|uniref:hypothetical protein n=1 Tax=Bradyrhizobium jicamae TaxID=280332 RepID=UPI001BA6EB06|nr:hypothetical protein [Bradyrhizobium jicamae]MBR0751575.1 hypothetical protein [Bradyrhizobium jicamae]
MRSSLFAAADGGKYMQLPNPMYTTFQSDAILRNGNNVGISQRLAYSANAGAIISLLLVDLEHATPGREVTILWGESNPQRRTVDRHKVREIRATVAQAPYFQKVGPPCTCFAAPAAFRLGCVPINLTA